MAIFCENCGNQLGEGVLFCANCGTKAEQDETAQAEYAPPDSQQLPDQQEYAPPDSQPAQQQPDQPDQGYGAPPYGQQPPPYGQQPGYEPPPPYGQPPGQQEYAPYGQQPPPYGQQPEYGAPYPPGQAPPPQPTQQKKKFPKWLLIIIIAAAAVVFALFVLVPMITNNNANKDFFTIGKDEVPSVKYILGEEREVTGVSSSISGGVETKVIEYAVEENQNSEMRKYAQALLDDYGYIDIEVYDFSGSSGDGFQFAKESVEEGYIVIVGIDYDTNGYTLTLSRGLGTLTIYEPEEPEVIDVPEEEEIEIEPEEEEPPVANPAFTVEIIMPEAFISYYTDEEIQEDAEYYGYEATRNPDGSYTYRMTEELQREFLGNTVDSIDSAFYLISESYEDVVDFRYSEDFSEIDVICSSSVSSDTFDEIVFISALSLGYTAPLYQVYQGMGNRSSTLVSFVDENTDEVIDAYTMPDELLGLFGL